MWSWTLLLEPSPCMRCVSAVWCVQCRVGLTREGNEGEWLWVIVWLLLTLWVKVASFLCFILNLVCYDVLDHCTHTVICCVEMCWNVLRCVEMCWDVLRCVDGRWNVDLDHNWSLPQHGETCLAAQGEIRPVRCRHEDRSSYWSCHGASRNVTIIAFLKAPTHNNAFKHLKNLSIKTLCDGKLGQVVKVSKDP